MNIVVNFVVSFPIASLAEVSKNASSCFLKNEWLVGDSNRMPLSPGSFVVHQLTVRQFSVHRIFKLKKLQRFTTSPSNLTADQLSANCQVVRRTCWTCFPFSQVNLGNYLSVAVLEGVQVHIWGNHSQGLHKIGPIAIIAYNASKRGLSNFWQLLFAKWRWGQIIFVPVSNLNTEIVSDTEKGHQLCQHHIPTRIGLLVWGTETAERSDRQRWAPPGRLALVSQIGPQWTSQCLLCL